MRFLFSIGVAITITTLQAQSYKSAKTPIETRINDLLKQMTLEEKILQISGDGLRTLPNNRLGIPGFEMSDGPIGVRSGKATAFPAGEAIASSWDTTLMAKLSKAIAGEAKAKGINMMLGPTVNIHRLPIGGRNFESFSEDPYLATQFTVAYIQAMQKEKVAVSVKHFCCNDQEWERMRVNAIIDERTMHEIHLPMFKAAALKANAYTYMSAYNKINGKYASENDYLLTEILKKQWNFQGLVVSDWEATHSTVPSANAGLDLEMPVPIYFGDSLLLAIKSGKVKESVLDDKVRRILRIKFLLGLFDTKTKLNEALVNTAENQLLALESATKGMILLKNTGLLPLSKTNLRSLAIIGPNANIARTGAGGSSQINPHYAISPLDAFKTKLTPMTKINFAQGDIIDIKGLTVIDSKYLVSESGEQGLTAMYWDKNTLEEVLQNKNDDTKPTVKRVDAKIDFVWNDPESPDPKIDKDYWTTKWTGKLKPPISRKYKIFTAGDDGVRVWFEDKLVIDNWDVHGTEKDSFEVDMEGFKTYKIKIEYFEGNMGANFKLGWDLPNDNAMTENGDLISQAVSIAKNSEAVVIFAGMSNQYESEGFDTKTGLNLPGKQDSLIMAVARTNPNTIVCLTNGNPVRMPWLKSVAGVIEGWYSGQEVGNAFADIILGNVNPSAKLTRSYITEESISPSYIGYKAEDITANYSEGIFVGYRYFDKMNIDPLFPFGFGLSYTKFEYSALSVKNLGAKTEISFSIKNVGKVEGEEIAQVYIKDKISSVDRPIKELKAFSKVRLAPNETKRVNLLLDNNESYSFYDIKSHKFIVELGDFDILVGASSKDIRLNASVQIK